MPGLVGIISKDKKYSDIFNNMLACLQHEPDYHIDIFLKDNEYSFGNISVALPHEPVYFYTDKVTHSFCMVDGEIYNYHDLKAKLREREGQTNLEGSSDAELLLALYTKYGEDFLLDLNGWFNLLIYDKERKKIIVANDRFGMKPLYYYRDENVFLFAPEVKAILENKEIFRDLNTDSICDFILFGCILENKTFFKDIFRLPPASKCVFQNNDCEIYSYWSWDEYRQLPKLSELEFIDRSDEVFQNTIPRYFRNNSDIVLSLSGGRDTRMILSALTPDLYPAKTISYGWHRNIADNVLAEKVSDTLGIPHEFIDMTEGSFTVDFMDKVVFLCDGMANMNCFALYFFFSNAYRGHMKNRIVVQGKYGTQVMHNARPPLKLKYNRIDRRMNTISQDIKENYVIPDILTSDGDNDLVAIIQEECRFFWYSNLAFENTMSVTRTPYLDNELIALLFQKPDNFNLTEIQKHFIRAHNTTLASLTTDAGLLMNKSNLTQNFLSKKYKLKALLTLLGSTRHIPPILQLSRLPLPANSVLYPRKLLMNTFFSKEVREVILEKRTLGRNHLDSSKVRKMIDCHFRGWTDYRREIARFLVIELFYRKFVD